MTEAETGGIGEAAGWSRPLRLLGLVILALALLTGAQALGAACGYLTLRVLPELSPPVPEGLRLSAGREPAFYLAQAWAALSLIVLAASCARWSFGGEWRSAAGLRVAAAPAPIWTLLLAWPVIQLAWVGVVALAGAALGASGRGAWFADVPQGSLSFALWLGVIVVLTPIGEELLFRGYLFARLRRIYGEPATLCLLAVLFACFHFDGAFYHVVATLPLGLATGWLRARTGSIWPAALLHIESNAVGIGLVSLAAP